MPVTAGNVLTGAPDQATTGAILTAALGGDMPESAIDTLPEDAASSGYVSEDGVTITPSRNTTTIKDWSMATVRKILDEFDGTIAWAHLETNEQALRNYFGDDNVEVTEATTEHGFQIVGKYGAVELPRQMWFFRIKDGLARVLIAVPDGQVTEQGEIELTKSGALTWPVVLSTYPDSEGYSIYVMTDDGVVAVSALPVISTILPSLADAGDLVTITGLRLTGATAVEFGATPATEFTVVNATTIVAVLPAVTGAQTVTVTTPAGESAGFSYTAGA